MCETSHICEVCRSRASNRCAGCSAVFYCSKEHQKQHWKAHKKSCRTYKIERDEVVGRHLVANRFIKSGETVLKVKPIVRGPAQVTGPVCLGCLENVDETNSRPCPRCGWPVCDKECQESPEHRFECEFTAKYRGKINICDWVTPHPLYRLITPIRLLTQMNDSKLCELESHCAMRVGTRQWVDDNLHVVQALRRLFPEHPYEDQQVLRACGILQINAHEVPLSHQPHVALYPAAGSMFEHRCLANCTKSFTDEETGELTVWAAMDVPAGQRLSICYTDPMWGTENRQHHLQESKLFQCSCPRCEDVTELGSYTSAILCPDNKCGGFVLPKQINRKQPGSESNPNGKSNGVAEESNKNQDNGITSTEANGNSAVGNISKNDREDISKTVKWDVDWVCESCGGEVTYDVIQRLLDGINEDVRVMERGSVDECKRFLNRHSSHLPLSHFAMLDVQIALAHLLGAGGSEQMSQLSSEDVAFKTELCEGLIERLKKIAPAECRALGSLYFELHSTLAETARRSGDQGRRLGLLRRSLDAAGECTRLLAKEPQCLHEGLLRTQAERNAADLRKICSAL